MDKEQFTTVQIQGITIETLFKKFEALENKIDTLSNPNPSKDEFLTRFEVSRLLNVTIVTVHNWTKNGILKPHKIGKKVLYRRTEIESVLTSKK